MTRNLKIPLLAALAATALGLAACGEEDRSSLLPGDTAAEIRENIATIQELNDSGQCLEATTQSTVVEDQVRSLDRSVDPELRSNLLQGVIQLQRLIQTECVSTSETEVVTSETEVPEATTEPDPEEKPGRDEPGGREQDQQQDQGGGKGGDDQGGTDQGGANQGNGNQGSGDQGGEPPTPTPSPTTPPSTTPPATTPPGSGGVSPGGVAPGQERAG